MSNKYELAPILLGLITSTWFTETLEKVMMTTIAMVVGTTVAFFWRRFLSGWIKSKFKKKNDGSDNIK